MKLDKDTESITPLPGRPPRPFCHTLTGENGKTYYIDHVIGSGGLGCVYRARLGETGPHVALKTTLRLGDESAQRSLIREADILASLDHEHIVRLLDRGRAVDGEPYLVMEYIHAPTLEQVLAAEGPLSLARAANICTQVIGAIDHLHGQGFIHNDLKPSNIAIGYIGTAEWVWVLDFGAARPPTDDLTGEQSYVMATIQYIAPERYNLSSATSRSDVYQLGLILYECLTGGLPFDDSLIEMIKRKSKGDIVPALSAEGMCVLPYAAKALIKKALSRDPVKRYATMQELLHELHQIASQQAIVDN